VRVWTLPAIPTCDSVHISDTVARLIWDLEQITFPLVLALPLMLADGKGFLGLIFMLAIAALANGAWFALLGVIVWYSREAFLKLRGVRTRRPV
jgi:hypothetical protein